MSLPAIRVPDGAALREVTSQFLLDEKQLIVVRLIRTIRMQQHGYLRD